MDGIEKNVELTAWREGIDFPRIQALIDQHIRESDPNGWTVEHDRLYCLVVKLDGLEKELKERQERMQRQEMKPESAVYLGLNKKFFLQLYREFNNLRHTVHRLHVKLYGPGETEKNGRSPKNEITPEMIERAKAYPIENLITVGRGNMVPCLWHDEKTPSMYVKNNFVHCFGCGKNEDTIGVYQALNGGTFPDAVRALQ